MGLILLPWETHTRVAVMKNFTYNLYTGRKIYVIDNPHTHTRHAEPNTPCH